MWWNGGTLKYMERSTITHVVNMLKSPPYNKANPTMCFRDTTKFKKLVFFASILNHTSFVTAGDVNEATNFSYKFVYCMRFMDHNAMFLLREAIALYM